MSTAKRNLEIRGLELVARTEELTSHVLTLQTHVAERDIELTEMRARSAGMAVDITQYQQDFMSNTFLIVDHLSHIERLERLHGEHVGLLEDANKSIAVLTEQLDAGMRVKTALQVELQQATSTCKMLEIDNTRALEVQVQENAMLAQQNTCLHNQLRDIATGVKTFPASSGVDSLSPTAEFSLEDIALSRLVEELREVVRYERTKAQTAVTNGERFSKDVQTLRQDNQHLVQELYTAKEELQQVAAQSRLHSEVHRDLREKLGVLDQLRDDYQTLQVP